MRKILTLLLFGFIATTCYGEGIVFDKQLSWTALKAKAKKENKYILMDCQTTWCGWCRKMEKDVFENDLAGDFFNAHFISVSVQFDQAPKDNDYVKGWYADAKQIEKDYPITGYPTCLIFAPDGNIVHRLVGYMPVAEFVAAGQKALTPDGQYFTLLKRYDAGERSDEFIKKFITVARGAEYSEMAGKVFNQYYPRIKQPFKKENLAFISENTLSTKDKGFSLFLNNPSKIDNILGKDAAEKKIKDILVGEAMSTLSKKKELDIDSLETVYHKKYPNVDIRQAFAGIKLQMLSENKGKFAAAAKSYVEKYGSAITPERLNMLAATIYQLYDDKDNLNMALDWSKRALTASKEKDYYTLYTYSVLLYKLDRKEEAIASMEETINLLSGDEKAQLEELLEKMRKGESLQRGQ